MSTQNGISTYVRHSPLTYIFIILEYVSKILVCDRSLRVRVSRLGSGLATQFTFVSRDCFTSQIQVGASLMSTQNGISAYVRNSPLTCIFIILEYLCNLLVCDRSLRIRISRFRSSQLPSLFSSVETVLQVKYKSEQVQ